MKTTIRRSFRLVNATTAAALSLAALHMVGGVSSDAFAQPVPSREPGSTHIFPAGGRRGTTVEVRVGAECIPPQTRFRIWGEGVTAPPVLGEKVQAVHQPSPHRKPTLIPISFAKEWQSKIEIAAGAPLGQKLWRLTCARGGTAGRPFIVGDLPEFIESESNSVPAEAERIELPVTVNGQIYGERDLDYFLISAEAGQVVTCDCLAQRLGSRLDPVLEARDAGGRRVATQEIRIGSDPVVAFRAPESGDYRIMISNVNFHGGPEYVYRMTVATEPFAPYAFPPGGRVGSSAQVQFHTLSGRAGDETPLQARTETVAFGPAGAAIPQGLRVATGLLVGGVPESVETEQNNAPADAMPLSLPVTVSGRFLSADDEDWFSFEAGKGQAFQITCEAYPHGGPAMPVLELSGADGDMILAANSAELPQRRIALSWQAPADAMYRLRLRDLQHAVRGGPEFIYRLTVQPASPDFTLRGAADFANVMQGGKAELAVTLERRGGFNGAVELTVEGLPEGVTAEPASIAENQNGGKIVLAAADEARALDATLRIVGRASLGQGEQQHVALAPHLGSDAEGVSAGSPSADHVHLTVQHKPVFRLYCQEAYQYAYRGTIHKYLMEVERLNGFNGPVVLQAGDRQNRDMDGVEILTVVVPPGQREVEVPIYFPETMHINVVSLTQLYTQGYAIFKDKFGNEQTTLVVSEKRNLVRTLPAVVKLNAADKALLARRGATATCRLQLERTSNFPGPMEVQLVAPSGAADISAEPVKLAAGQDSVEVPVHVAADAQLPAGGRLTFRATGMLYDKFTVISEASVSLRLQ